MGGGSNEGKCQLEQSDAEKMSWRSWPLCFGGKCLPKGVLQHQQVHTLEMQIPTTWSHVQGSEESLGKLESTPPVAALSRCFPNRHPSLKHRSTHHLESTSVGRVSELREPWGRRFLGPGKRHTHPVTPSGEAEGLPHSAMSPISRSEHPLLNEVLVRDQIIFFFTTNRNRGSALK